MARQGLRTLVLGLKELGEEECRRFVKELGEAKVAMEGRGDKVD